MMYRPVRPNALPSGTPDDPNDIVVYSPSSGPLEGRLLKCSIVDFRTFLLGPALRGQFVATSSTAITITSPNTPVVVTTLMWQQVQASRMSADDHTIRIDDDGAESVDAVVLVECKVTDGGQSVVTMGLRINGQEVMSSPPTSMQSPGSKLILITYLGPLAPDDVLDLVVESTQTSPITVTSARLTTWKPCP